MVVGRDVLLAQEQERDTNAPKQFRLKSSRGQQHAVSIGDLDLDMPTSATTSPCPAIRDIMALEMGPAFRARWATLRSQRVSRFNAAVLLRA